MKFSVAAWNIPQQNHIMCWAPSTNSDLPPCLISIHLVWSKCLVWKGTNIWALAWELCGSTNCSPTQYAPFSSILCTLHTQYAPLEHFVYPAYTICYQWSILCRVDTYVISVVVRGYTICSSWKHVSWYLPFFLTVLSTSICLSYEP